MGKLQDALHCTFCGKNRDQVAKLIAGPAVFICDECVDVCNQILAEEGPYDRSTVVEAQKPADLSDEQLMTKLRTAGRVAQHQVDQVKHAVSELRKRGVTWAVIGQAFGTTRQAAWERFSGED